MKKYIIIFCVFVVILCGVLFLSYKNGIKSVSNNTKNIDFQVESGSNFYSIASKLKEAGLIKSELFYKIFIKINKVSSIQSGVYSLSPSMSVKEITDRLQGSSKNPNVLSITFKEGYNMNDIIDVIVNNTNNTKEDILAIINDSNYLNSLIEKYWFIDESILNPSLYYSLEGYLYPNTYQFNNKDVSPQEIFNVMINQMDKQLSSYQDKINISSYTPHQILTLASIVEQEGLNSSDRRGIAGVFYNRLNSNMSLGSDVTAYYGAKVKMSDRDLYVSELNDPNPYNTRSSTMAGKLPIGPICNPSIDSIEAVVEPEQHDYYYFVSDKNGKTYFTRNSREHNLKISELKEAGLWFTY